MLRDVEVLILRGTVGGLLAGHGAQKLFGAFGGPGLKGTAGMMQALNLQPADQWAMGAALSEFGGGVLTALGLLNPLGPIGVISAMAMATGTVHWGKPIWVTQGGAELPVTNIAAVLALAIAGPGKYSLDNAFGITLPKYIPAIAGLSAAGLIAYALSSRAAQQALQQQQPGDEIEGQQRASA